MDYTTKKSVYSPQQTGVVIEESGSPAQAAPPDFTLQIAELRRRSLIMELKGLNKILGYGEKEATKE